MTRIVMVNPTPAATAEPEIVTLQPPEIGSAERPVVLVFAPTTTSTTLAQRAEHLAAYLAEQSGLAFETIVAASESEAVERLCQFPAETIALMQALSYVEANRACGAQAGLVALEDNVIWNAGMFLVPRSANVNSLAELAGLNWGLSSLEDVATGRYPQAMFNSEDVVPGEIREFGNESAAMLALLAGEVDFVTATFTPPQMPLEESIWSIETDDPEIWRGSGLPLERSPLGYILVGNGPDFGGYRIRDARAVIFDIQPAIFDQSEILQLTDPLPNQTVAAGGQMPLAIARQILGLISDYVNSEDCQQSLCAPDFYHWEGVQEVDDTFFQPLQFLLDSEAGSG